MEDKTGQNLNTRALEKPTIKGTLEDLYFFLLDLDLCYSKRDFSTYWLGKSPRYFSTLQSENGNGSFEVLLYAKEMIKSTIADFDTIDHQSGQFKKLVSAHHYIESQIEEMRRNLIVE